MDASKVINGSWGEVLINEDYMAEVISLEAKATLEKQEVNQTGTLAKGYKITGLDCKGTIKLNKVTSYFINMISDNLLKGKSTECTITSTLSDPDSDGTEKIELYGCIFDELTLANWEAKKLTEESIPFTFTSWKIVDKIDDERTKKEE